MICAPGLLVGRAVVAALTAGAGASDMSAVVSKWSSTSVISSHSSHASGRVRRKNAANHN